jgi:hypothetical protein
MHFEDSASHVDDVESRPRADFECDSRLVNARSPIPLGPRAIQQMASHADGLCTRRKKIGWCVHVFSDEQSGVQKTTNQ